MKVHGDAVYVYYRSSDMWQMHILTCPCGMCVYVRMRTVFPSVYPVSVASTHTQLPTALVTGALLPLQATEH